MADDPTFTKQFDGLDITIAIDLMMTILTTMDNPEVSDEEFRVIVVDKMENLKFLIETGVISQTEEEERVVRQVIETMIEEGNNGN